jgi:hypothetical protein
MLVPISPQSASLGLSSGCIETLAGAHADQGQDTDGDDHYEHLLVDVRVEVTQTSDFALAGTLVDSQGDEIASTVSYAFLDVGSREMTLAFDGKVISDHGAGGPYRLNHVVLMDVSSAAIEVDKVSNVYLTGGHDYDDF